MKSHRVALAALLIIAVVALVSPLDSDAQPPGKSHRIAYLALTPGEDGTLMKALVERLHELGYREGTNMTFDYRSADGHPERLSQLATALVQGKPDVLVAGFGTLAAKAAKAATATIPIVFTTVGDPVGAGLVASLAQPGGNVTGMTDQAKDLGGKRLQLLQELAPGRHTIGVLMNPDTPFTALALGAPAGTFFDFAALHLLTTGTLDRLRALYPQGRFEVRRFRPNLVVTTAPGNTEFPERTGWAKRWPSATA